MFTGIVEELGEVVALDPSGDGARLGVRASTVTQDVIHGGSIAVNGTCLTVVEQSADGFVVDVMAETLRATTTGGLRPGDRVNLERATPVHGRLDGHVVQGHVDATAEVLAVTPGERWSVVRFGLPREVEPLVAHKGSIAVDGVSLTVSAVSEPGVEAPWFEVSLIPETLAVTTLGRVGPGARVNLETDVIARQVQRMLAFTART